MGQEPDRQAASRDPEIYRNARGTFYGRYTDSSVKKSGPWPILQILTVHTGDLDGGDISTIYLREGSIVLNLVLHSI